MVKPKETSEWLHDLANCNEILSNNEVNTFGNIINKIDDDDDGVENVSNDDDDNDDDEVDEDLEADSRRLNKILGLPTDTYSLTRIMPNLPECMKYIIRSGLTHMSMNKFPPFSRGLQGFAIAITAYATTELINVHNWNESIIDQIIEDGDMYYRESYEKCNTKDRRLLGIDDLNKSINIQKTHKVHIYIDDAIYTGVFHSKNPTEMHLVKALELFFQKYNSGLLTSLHLNISIWRDGKYFHIFDGQSRHNNNLLPDNTNGSGKLIIVHDIVGVYFIILEKSNVTNEHFVLYPLNIVGISRIIEFDNIQPLKSIGKPQRRSSGYNIHGLRALIRGNFHIMHDIVPEIIRGHTHLIIALIANIYSRLIQSNKWTNAIIDLIFNQSHIYFIDFIRIIEKKIDKNFNLNIDDLLSDIVLGVYEAKIKIQSNIIPGDGKKSKGKGKITLNTGFYEFFKQHETAIIEIKNIFYAVWKDSDKYYFFDPFACDETGFRVDFNDTKMYEKYKNAKSCVTMNSTIDELVENILENTSTMDKDPFILHQIEILYIKTVSQGLPDTVIYREKKTNRRPLPSLPLHAIKQFDECKIKLETIPKQRIHADQSKTEACQYPELFRDIDDYMMKDNEFITNNDKEVQQIVGYSILNSHRIILQGTKNCMDDSNNDNVRGQQGLSMAISAMAYSKLKNSSQWRNFDIDKIIDLGNEMHYNLLDGINLDSIDEYEKNEDDDSDDDDDDDDDEVDEETDDDNVNNVNEEKKKNNDIILDSGIEKQMNVSMLPAKIKFGDNIIKLKKRMSIAQGDADPIVNLGEAFDQYFTKYNELILENTYLMYGIWKLNGYYFVFNPYGSDKEGWLLRNYPASFIVTDTINELVDLFYGILQFNDRIFYLHFIHIESIEPGKYNTTISIDVPENNMEKYQTLFLPLTDDDLSELKIHSNEKIFKSEVIDIEKNINNNETVYEDNDVNENEIHHEEEDKVVEFESVDLNKKKKLTGVNSFMDIKEKDRFDAPSQLNLFLVTTNVNLVDEIVDSAAKEAVEFERLKYNHPPPYILPSKRVLTVLLAAKKASKSISSLVSCFSIDSKLAVKIDFSINEIIQRPSINNINGEELSKIIKLPPTKYLYSRISPIGFTPLRAIDEKFIHDKKIDDKQEDECRKKKLEKSPGIYYTEEIPESIDGICITPIILPLGPLIKTPLPKIKTKPCVERKKRRCKLSETKKDNEILKKLICNTDEVLFDMIFSKLNSKNEEKASSEFEKDENEMVELNPDEDEIQELNDDDNEEINETEESVSQFVGFHKTNGDNEILLANMKLNNRAIFEEYHFKSCYFAAILCILAKTKIPINEFNSNLLDELIVYANKIIKRTDSLRYKERRTFNNIKLHDVNFNIIMKQYIYADPKNHKPDLLSNILEEFFKKYFTGILVFLNASYAFWYGNNESYYLFDPYSCDEAGRVNENGNACLLKFSSISDLIEKIEHHSGITIDQPYRIHILSIAHIEHIKQQKILNKKLKQFNTNIPNDIEHEKFVEDINTNEIKSMVKQNVSLIELSDWLNDKNKILYEFDMNIPGFAPLTNINASVLDVKVIENDITQPILTPFIYTVEISQKISKSSQELPRLKPFDRKFNQHSILCEPLDLCIMAWSCIHEPTVWGVRTIRGIYDASEDLAYDSMLSAEDTTVSNMIDGVLNEFDIGNYRFHAIFAPIHIGKLYSNEGWNLAMSLKKIFDTLIYTGAIISCGKSHIGVMKKNKNFYAWWCNVGSKNLRIVTTQIMKDFLILIIQQIDELNEIEFKIRIITISYARKLDPDCSDINGLHEMNTVTSLPQIYRKQMPIYDIKNLFRSKIPDSKPIFICGSVALNDYELIKEPRIKRCYFIAIVAVMVKRDIMQSLTPNIIDKIIQIGENLYREFNNPKYHTEHILRNVTVMNRIFDFRDVTSSLYKFKVNISMEIDDFYSLVKKKLQQYFQKYSHGILHFTNCCYGFWYSQSTTYYYYLDPYQCNNQGERILNNGNGCLGIFSSLNQMVKCIKFNCAPNTTGFFIHRIHIESINVLPSKKFIEDPMWIYLDYHWSASHVQLKKHNRHKKKHTTHLNKSNDEYIESKTFDRPSWNHYTIEIPNLIYSIWGTLGAYNSRFGERAGKNQVAISIAVLAMQHLCHPSKWSAAILDSAVICGDCYYTESIKSAARNGIKYSNIFNLQPCFKVFPHIWKIEYGAKMCGILYGGNKRTSLATTLKLAMEQSSNILIKCGKITLAVLFADDGYYAADPCWTGPPLFLQNHGALYVLRCKNLNTLVYTLIKMINSNQRLEFTVTPVEFNFKHEICLTSNQKNRTIKKRILSNTLECEPSDAVTPKLPVSGAIAVGDNDIYQDYRKNVELGIQCGEFFESPPIPSPVPQLDEQTTRNLIISTEWHNNIGRKHLQSNFNAKTSRYDTEEAESCPSLCVSSFTELFNVCNEYPKTVDFLHDKNTLKSIKQLTKKNIATESSSLKPLDCLPPTDFILRRSKNEYMRQVIDLTNDSYKWYKHKIDDDNGNNSKVMSNNDEE